MKRWLKFADDDFWRMLSGFIAVLVLVVLTIVILDKLALGDMASVSVECFEEICR